MINVRLFWVAIFLSLCGFTAAQRLSVVELESKFPIFSSPGRAEKYLLCGLSLYELIVIDEATACIDLDKPIRNYTMDVSKNSVSIAA